MFRLFPLKRFVVAALLIASLFLVLPAGARSGETSNPPSALLTSNVPSTVFPAGTVPIKRIIYIWSAVDGATQYEYQLYFGTTQILDQVADASVCVSGTCSVMPAVDLSAASYTWRVRALVGGVYQPYSASQAFTVVVESTGFSSSFTTDAIGWVVHKGTWSLEGSNYITTTGVVGKAATISHTSDYSTLTYEVRMKRTGCIGCANVLAIRGNPSLDTVGWWKTEYTFDYTNNGLFSVWKDNNGTYTALKNWTSTTAINKGGWNTLKVTANGSTLKFYINDILVWSGSDASYPSGRVGIGMYRSTTSTGDKLWIDWAQLTTTVTSSVEMNIPDTQEEVTGGNRNMAP